MKFLLIVQADFDAWEAMSDAERAGLADGRADFVKAITRSGEMISANALADPTNSSVVHTRDGVRLVDAGPYEAMGRHLSGYYLVECASRDRAVELALLIPDTRVKGLSVEVRQVLSSSGADL